MSLNETIPIQSLSMVLGPEYSSNYKNVVCTENDECISVYAGTHSYKDIVFIIL